MGTSGSRGRLHRAVGAAATVAALAAAVGCWATGDRAGGPGAVASSPPATGVPPGHRPGRTGPAGPPARFCPVRLPARWRDALDAGRLRRRPGESLVVHAVGADGRTAVADSRLGDTRTVEFLRGGTRRDVLTLDRPDTDQLYGAAFDGRYLVFSISHDPSDLSDWTLYSWDSRTGGTPRVLAHNAVHADGRPAASPMLYPVVAGGRAAWTAGTADGRDELHRYDLDTGTDHVVRDGHPGAPFLYGGNPGAERLVWPESPEPDRLTELHAVDLDSGRPVSLPKPLAAVRGAAFIAGNGDTAAWVGPDVRTLWVWRAGWPRAVRALSVPEGTNLQWVHLAGSLVTWDNGSAQFAADLRTGGYTQLTREYGYTVASGNALAVGYPPDGKTPSSDAPTLVRAGDLPPLPGC